MDNKEIEYDKKMKITAHTKDLDVNYYSCEIPWKDGDKPDLTNNLPGVITRQKRTCSQETLEKKGTTIEEINAKFQSDLEKGFLLRFPGLRLISLIAIIRTGFVLLIDPEQPQK
jgi:hypothetical protein